MLQKGSCFIPKQNFHLLFEINQFIVSDSTSRVIHLLLYRSTRSTILHANFFFCKLGSETDKYLGTRIIMFMVNAAMCYTCLLIYVQPSTPWRPGGKLGNRSFFWGVGCIIFSMSDFFVNCDDTLIKNSYKPS